MEKSQIQTAELTKASCRRIQIQYSTIYKRLKSYKVTPYTVYRYMTCNKSVIPCMEMINSTCKTEVTSGQNKEWD